MSSKRKMRRKSCLGKLRHKDEASAVYAMARTGGVGLRVYICKFCGFYHVGHMNLRQKKGMAASRGQS